MIFVVRKALISFGCAGGSAIDSASAIAASVPYDGDFGLYSKDMIITELASRYTLTRQCRQ